MRAAAEDLLNDKVKQWKFWEVLQCLNHKNEGLDLQLAEILLVSNRGQALIIELIKDKFLQDVKDQGLSNAIDVLSNDDGDDDLNKTFDALINTEESSEILVDRALEVWVDEIRERVKE